MARRLTRVEQQRRTNTQLRTAGGKVFLRRGYLSPTVDEIAAEAGYTRGAVYKHFGGKEGLWLAIVETRQAAQLARLAADLDAVADRDELIAMLTPAAGDADTVRWSIPSMEFLASVAGRAEHTAAVAGLHRRWDAAVTEALDRTCRRLGLRPALPVPDLVAALDALGSGLSLRHALDSTMDSATVSRAAVAAWFPAGEGTPT